MIFKKYKKKIRYWVISLVLKFKKYNIENSIIIFSEPRGGSTWLMEIFNELPNTIVNSEPLHANSGVVPKIFNFGWYPFLPMQFSEPKFKLFFFNIFSFKIFNKWTTSFVSFKNILGSKIVITKFVLANQLLAWISYNFGNKLNHKPIYLVRHPIPTCVSQLKTFHNIKGNKLFELLSESDKFIVPNSIFNERFKIYECYINSLNSRIERHIALWCINNGNLLNEVDRNNWVTLFYEDLIIKPETEIFNLLTLIKFNFNKKDLEKINFRKPSHSNFNKDFKKDVNEQISSSLNSFALCELQKIQAVLDYFNIKIYSAFSPNPIK